MGRWLNMRITKRGITLTIRVCLTMLGIAMVVFGFSGFVMVLGIAAREPQGIFYDEKPLYSVEGIAVDSAGNLYFGNREHQTIHVYDNEGRFLYRFSRGGEGSYIFYIDEDDIVHVATARQDRVFSFKDGVLIAEHEYAAGYEQTRTFEDFSQRQRTSFTDKEGNTYVVTSRTVTVYDQQGELIRSVTPRGPTWPLHSLMYWGTMAVGLLLSVLPNLKDLNRLFKELEDDYFRDPKNWFKDEQPKKQPNETSGSPKADSTLTSQNPTSGCLTPRA